MADDDIRDQLDRLVPPPPATPTMPELASRGRAYRRRRDAGIASASLAAVAAAAFIIPSLSLSRDGVQPSGRSGTEGAATEDGGSVSCPEDGITTSTEYAPPQLPTPEDALRDGLSRLRRVTATADDFTEVRRSEDEVRYELVVDDRVQGVAVASRGDDGWSLPVLITCASLDEE